MSLLNVHYCKIHKLFGECLLCATKEENQRRTMPSRAERDHRKEVEKEKVIDNIKQKIGRNKISRTQTL